MKLLSAFHPQTDGQSEAANKKMERYLRSYVNYQQDDWKTWLPMAEFVENVNLSTSSGMSLFFANYGFEPRIEFDTNKISDPESTRERLEQGHARTLIDRMEQIWTNIRIRLQKAQNKMTEFANRKRKNVNYEVEEKVFLSTKNIDTTRPSKKLDLKIIEPFEIIRKTEGSYELDLPELIKRKFPIFHSSLLRRAAENPLPGQIEQPEPPIMIKGEEQYEVDDILDARKRYGKVQFKAKWKGYPMEHPENDTWYDASDFTDSKELVEDFYTRYPRKPRWSPPEDAE
jgi:Chromo (CHRromatin Organisation MOdifier) domain